MTKGRGLHETARDMESIIFDQDLLPAIDSEDLTHFNVMQESFIPTWIAQSPSRSSENAGHPSPLAIGDLDLFPSIVYFEPYASIHEIIPEGLISRYCTLDGALGTFKYKF